MGGLDSKHGFDLCSIDGVTFVFANEVSSINHRDAITGIEDKAEHLFAYDDGQVLKLSNLTQRTRDVLDDGGLNAFRWLIQKKDLGVRH